MKIPKEVQAIVKRLSEAGFQAYIVGGCVRDLLLGREPQDWDVTTDAKPEEIQKLFPDSFYENKFGTVGVKTESKDPKLTVVEVTTFRAEERYTDKRHPDEVRFVGTLDEDLKRRDFTMNALAMDAAGKVVDLFDGEEDLEDKLIRAVGDPKERFAEDALRMLRAVRFAAELVFEIEEKTREAIQENSAWIKAIAKERIRDELIKLVMSPKPWKGFEILRELELLKFITPELEEGYGVSQNKHHIYTVWEHNMRSLQYAADKKYSLEVRLAALLHDVAKPHTKRGEGPDSTFYGHEIVGAKMTAQIMGRLHFPREIADKVTLLVRNHLFYYETEQVTDASVRRLVRRVGPENIQDLVHVRESDRIGSGVPKAVPYKLRHFMFRVEKVLHEPVSLKQLKVGGNDVMETLKIEPGPKVGMILNALFEEVLDDPKKNKREYLVKRMKELGKLSDEELRQIAKKAESKYEALLEAEEEAIKRKYFVK